MPVYRLTPINPADPNWRRSAYVGEVIVRAASEDKARFAAHSSFDSAQTKQELRTDGAVSLWEEDSAVRCEPISDSRYPDDGPTGVLEPKHY